MLASYQSDKTQNNTFYVNITGINPLLADFTSWSNAESATGYGVSNLQEQ